MTEGWVGLDRMYRRRSLLTKPHSCRDEINTHRPFFPHWHDLLTSYHPSNPRASWKCSRKLDAHACVCVLYIYSWYILIINVIIIMLVIFHLDKCIFYPFTLAQTWSAFLTTNFIKFARLLHKVKYTLVFSLAWFHVPSGSLVEYF